VQENQPSLKILTNHWGQQASPTWRAVSTLIRPQGNVNAWLPSLKLALRLYFRRLNFDCVVLGAGRSDLLFALLQALLPFRKCPAVMLDCLWYKHPNIIRHLIWKLVLGIVDRGTDRFVVWARREIEAFSSAFDLPAKKFSFVPYHTTFETPVGTGSPMGDYVFSGGNSDRDYFTLIEAVRELNVKVFIATQDYHLPEGFVIPSNVDIRGYSHHEYVKVMAGCMINVVALKPGLVRSAGQQTFLNSMLLGKPTIVMDVSGAADYIDHDEDGLLVQAGDSAGLRKAIKTLLANPSKAREMGAKAIQKAKTFSTEQHFKKLVLVVEEVLASKKATSSS
jgi:glycosyltransferase involved in cell wall biosynthesis